MNHGEFLFIVEQILLRVYDIQIIHQATGVAAAGNVQSASRRIDRPLLRLVRFCLLYTSDAADE